MQYKKQDRNPFNLIYNSEPVDISYKSSDERYSQNLKEHSPEFIKIISQLNIAEKHNLNYLLKLGYRKAIEQLVWDYLIEFENKTENSLQKKTFQKELNCLISPKHSGFLI